MAGQGTYQPVSMGGWMLTMGMMCLPLVNLIMLFVWAFGSQTPISKANWAKAALFFMLIGAGLSVVLALIGGLTAALG